MRWDPLPYRTHVDGSSTHHWPFIFLHAVNAYFAHVKNHGKYFLFGVYRAMHQVLRTQTSITSCVPNLSLVWPFVESPPVCRSPSVCPFLCVGVQVWTTWATKTSCPTTPQSRSPSSTSCLNASCCSTRQKVDALPHRTQWVPPSPPLALKIPYRAFFRVNNWVLGYF